MKKKLLIAIAILGGILMLGGAAFLGARLLAPTQAANNTSGGPGKTGRVIASKGGGGPDRSVELITIPAEEIPQRSPEMHGAVTEIKDNSLMVTSVKSVMVMRDESGDTKTDFDYEGSAVEVVVTQETEIYNDTTYDDLDMLNKAPEESKKEYQQTLETVAFSDIAPQTMVTVWGYKRGDRLVAEVIVAETP